MDIRHNDWPAQHINGVDKFTRDVLAAYARAKYPSNAAKLFAIEFDLTLDEGRGVVAGRASQATIDKIWKHPKGGWRVVIPVMSAVIGQPFEDFHEQERRHHEELARRHRALVRDRVSDHNEGDGPGAELGRSSHLVGGTSGR